VGLALAYILPCNAELRTPVSLKMLISAMQNNINVINNPPPRQVTTPAAAGKSPISSAVGQSGESAILCLLACLRVPHPQSCRMSSLLLS
jgi:hypothetical protein